MYFNLTLNTSSLTVDETLIIDPPVPFSIIPLTTTWLTFKTDLTLMLIVLENRF